ncbi:SDR family oxidoreductase [uncultured Bradyrhizobium sp.]|uniref:SDR family oxidoreductase n=1 Tax=uncultured Bradyrhizobium sp. TaxID=199684 RepID=UPI0035CA5421
MTVGASDQRRVAIVFGGSRGIGAGIAQRLAADGFAVALTYLGSADRAAQVCDAIAASGGQAIAVRADSTDSNAVRLAVQQTIQQFGRPDVVVVNAGILKLGPIHSFAIEDFDRLVDVNIRGVFLSIQATMAAIHNGGRIITIGSNGAIRVGSAQGAIYAMTEAAIASLIKGLALELAPRGITANNVQPGPIDTDMTDGMIDALTDRIPLRRIGKPADVAALVSYLASDGAGFMTGESLTIDGGFVL